MIQRFACHVAGQFFAVFSILIAGSHAAEPAAEAEFTVRVLGPDRKPVAGALVGSWATRNADNDDGWQFVAEIVGDGVLAATTDERGEARLFVGRLRSRTRELALVAQNEARHLVGIKPVSRDPLRQASRANSPIEIMLEPECRMHGKIESKSLAELGRPLEHIGISLEIDDRAAFTFVSSRPEFEFFAPPGKYTLSVMAADALSSKVALTVPPGTTQLELDTIDLLATNMVRLAGRTAPELADVLAWKNTEPLKLADLRGKYVLLDFWGYWCGTCLIEMPKLFDLQARYPGRLVVIGVHVGVEGDGIDTVAKLDAELSEVRKTIWKGRDLPFPVAMLASRERPHSGSDRSARTQTSADYGVQGYPTQILIDPQGNVVGEFDSKRHLKLFD